MKPLKSILAAAAMLMLAGPAFAQNAVQVDRATSGASCPHCNLFQASFANAEIRGRNFAGARLRQADFSTAVMNHSNFAGTDMRDVNAYGAVFSGANFAGADLTHASFVGTWLNGANFAGARMAGTNFSGADMDHARGLSQRQLDGACGDVATTLPAGLGLHACR